MAKSVGLKISIGMSKSANAHLLYCKKPKQKLWEVTPPLQGLFLYSWLAGRRVKNARKASLYYLGKDFKS